MTVRQTILKLFYPAWMLFNKLIHKRRVVTENKRPVKPPRSFYDLSVQLNNGNELKFDTFRGKKVLIVNTASDCGFTPQYDDLQQLYQQNKPNLVIIGFPANDFGQQEKGNDEAISEFCKVNFGVSFPLAKKSIVIKSSEQHEVFKWLTDKNRNGWNDQSPVWNFSKYLVNEQGVLVNYFEPAVPPLSDEVRKAITKS